ncbi:MAG: hypothetical protein ABIY55_36320 [Kofleriaceae bacterium]
MTNVTARPQRRVRVAEMCHGLPVDERSIAVASDRRAFKSDHRLRRELANLITTKLTPVGVLRGRGSPGSP